MEAVFFCLIAFYFFIFLAALIHQFWFRSVFKSRYPTIYKEIHTSFMDRSFRSDINTAKWFRNRNYADSEDTEMIKFLDRYRITHKSFLISICLLMLVILIIGILVAVEKGAL